MIICEPGGGSVRLRSCGYTTPLNKATRTRAFFQHLSLPSGIAFISGNRRKAFLGDSAFHPRSESLPRRNADGTGESRCHAASDGAPVPQRCSQQTAAQPLGEDEGQKVGPPPCFLALGGNVCDANPGASDNGSLAFQENCFSAFPGLLTWLLWV